MIDQIDSIKNFIPLKIVSQTVLETSMEMESNKGQQESSPNGADAAHWELR